MKATAEKMTTRSSSGPARFMARDHAGDVKADGDKQPEDDSGL